MFMHVTELLSMLGHNPDQVQWDHVKLGPNESDLFLVFRRLGFRNALCLAYEMTVDGVSVTFKLKSAARFDPTLVH